MDEKNNQQSDEPELTYFDRSRRQFIKLSGLALAGLMFPGSPWQTAAAQAAERTRVGQGIAWALQDAGVGVVTHVPATGATDVFDLYCRLVGMAPPYSFNEEVAYTMAHGAALAGSRSAAVLKSHGLAKASNSIIDSLTLGTTAGFVAIVLDDPTGKHSDNVFDLNAFLQGTGMPFRKATASTAYADLLACFAWSEELGIPVALLLSSDFLADPVSLSRKRLAPSKAVYKSDPLRHALCPPLAPYQHKVLQARLARTDWRKIPEPKLPNVPEGLPPKWRVEASRFVPVFEVLREFRPQIPFVSGDTGLSTMFALPPFFCVDASSYYGGSLPLAMGFHLGGFGRTSGRPWAITGDYAFLAAGHMGLIEAVARKMPLKVLIFDNGRAAASGGQPVPEGLLDQELAGWGALVSRVENPQDKNPLRKIIDRAIRSDRLEIISARFRS